MPSIEPSSRVWLITGASAGFGQALASHALDNGDTVVATMQDPTASSLTMHYPEHIRTDKLLILKLDVTKAREISEVFKTAKDKYGRIDIVFNNAGRNGEIEQSPANKARALFDTTFWGAANVSREAIKCFRENSPPGGRLLQHFSSSVSECNPGAGYYGASKAALESFTEALSQEIDPKWRIKITIVESGPFNSKLITDNSTVLPLRPASSETYKAVGYPEKGAKIYYRLSRMDEPPFRLPLHAVPIACAKARIESLRKGIEGYASWSEEIF